MTLAEFARQIGIEPATARQWKKRGRIVERDSGEFELRDRDSVTGLETVTERDVTERDSVIAESVTEGVTDCHGVTEQSVTGHVEALNPESCAGCETVGREVASLRMAIVVLSGEFAGLRDRVAVLEEQIGEASQRVASPRRKSNYAGAAASLVSAFDDGDGPAWGA